jgi:hypothetical protein
MYGEEGERTLRRHPENRPLHAHVLVVLVDIPTLLTRSKVRDLAESVLVDEDVVGLHVAVEDPERMEVLEAVEDLVREVLDDVFFELRGEGEGQWRKKGKEGEGRTLP